VVVRLFIDRLLPTGQLKVIALAASGLLAFDAISAVEATVSRN
jgi:hypothetical protein